MTQKESILFRLTELMLQKQQTFLLLDDLYEDEIIESSIRNIQIDSPFQQLLFEGVLSQYIIDDAVSISFTVEAYFQHLLARVLEKDKRYITPENLLQLLKENKLKGLPEAISNLLSFDIENSDFIRLTGFIDLSEEVYEILNVCIKSVIHSFKINGIEKSLKYILEHSTNNDWRILMQTILAIENSQKNSMIKDLSDFLFNNYLLKDDKGTHVSAYVLKFLDKDKAENLIKHLEDKYETYQYINDLDRYSLYNSLASFYSYKGNHEKAIVIYKQSFELISKTNFFTPHIEALLYNEFGLAYYYSGDSDNALLFHSKSLKLRSDNYPNLPILKATSLNNIGLAHNGLSRYDEAMKCFTESAIIQEMELGAFTLAYAVSIHNIGLTFLYKREYSKAIEYLNKSYEIKVMNLGEVDSDVATTSNVLGATYLENKDLPNALKWLSKTLESRIKLFGNYHYSLEGTYSYLVELYIYQNNYERAEYFCNELVENQKIINGHESEKTSLALFTLGDIHFENGEFVKSILSFKESLGIEVKLFGLDNYNLSSTYKNIALAYNELEEFHNAIEYYNFSLNLELAERTDNDEIINLYDCLGDCYLKMEIYKNAISNYISSLGFSENGTNNFKIGVCYEKMAEPSKAFYYFIKATELLKSEYGIEDENTIEALNKVKEIAKELNKENELPNWIKEIN